MSKQQTKDKGRVSITLEEAKEIVGYLGAAEPEEERHPITQRTRMY
jgi:hypothetical protein